MNHPKPVLRKKPLNSAGECAILITYRAKGEPVPLKISTGVYVKEEYFNNDLITEPDFATRQIKQQEVNDFIIRLNKIIRLFQEDGTAEPTAKQVKEKYDELYNQKQEGPSTPKPVVRKKLKPLEAFQKFIDDSDSGKRRSASGGFIEKGTVKNYRSTKLNLEKFQTHAKYDLSKWENFNDEFYFAFTDYCFDVLNHFDNNVGKYVKQIRTWLNWCTAKGIIPEKIYNEKWKVWVEKEVDSMVLWPDELKVIARLPDKTFNPIKNGIRTRDLFIMGCITCVRISDLWKLGGNHGIIEKRNGNYFFSFDQKKTDENAGIEVAPVGKKILDKYYSSEEGFPKIHDVTYNKDLKEFGAFMKRHFINHQFELEKEGLELQDWGAAFRKRRRRRGKVAQIDNVKKEAFTSHLMRRTGITSLAIAGLNKDEIKKVSGHTTDTEIDKYIKVADKFRNKTVSKAWATIFG